MIKTKLSKRITSILLCIALLLTYVPLSAFAAESTKALGTSAIAGIVVDPGTADSWETMMGTDIDGNRYAGRVWVDKSVCKNGDTVVLDSKGNLGSSFNVSLADDEAFQIVFSALGSTMTSKSTISTTGPLDVVLILDTSTSMDDVSGGKTRLERVITSANALIDDLLTIKNVRIAIVTYNNDSETVIDLDSYNNGIDLVVTNYYNNGRSDAGVVTAYDDNNKKLGSDDGYTQGTNLQAGIDKGFNILANATNVEGRVPVAIVLTDGQANRANRSSFYSGITSGSSVSDERLILSTLLNAAYNKSKVEANYGTEQKVYGIGVDLGNNSTAHVLMNPGDSSNRGFNSSNRTGDIRDAYNHFVNWSSGSTVNIGNGQSRWTFDHNYPTMNGSVTRQKITANINYVDTYYDVASADLDTTFAQIYEELSSGAFNPISSSTSVDGATGEDNTPLIYVDFIGQHMEIKEIQAVTLFGASYGVIHNADGTYTVDTATGVNPATNEAWNTSEDIKITIIEQEDGTQKLEIRLNQQILPIIVEQIVSQTVGDVTTSTITEIVQEPLRVFYTVGLDSDILLPNGKVDVSKIQGYEFVDNANGTVSFYSNRFGVMNEADDSGALLKGDAHVGFKPSLANRYYYHQSNQGIFTKITNKSDNSIVTIPENAEYGIPWDESKYNLSWMTYDEYLAAKDSDKVYTYVSYYHPTKSATDAANAAEEVTYLVYTDWGYLKESVAFYDSNAEKYINNGVAINENEVADVIAEYMRDNPNAEIYAVLGVGSLRTSRLHNMTVDKSDNLTDTAVVRYAPEYTHDTASVHNGNDVVVWLGNNGRLTVNIDTGIVLTKNVTEAIGDANDTYALTVSVPNGVAAIPVVSDANGNNITSLVSTYINNVLTVNVKANETVYISGIPGGTVCAIGENIPDDADYYIADKTDTVVIPTVSEALNGAAQYMPAFVTNAPNKYGNLYITKEINSDHIVPENVLNESFEIKVNVGSALAGKSFSVVMADSDDSSSSHVTEVTVDSNGYMTFDIKARQTIEILRLPAGIKATVIESAPDSHFAVSYRTRNHSGENADSNNEVVIPSEGNATAIVINTYTPGATSVDLDIVGTKNFTIEGNHNGGAFVYKVQKWNGNSWVDISGKTALTEYAANESGTKNFRIEDVLSGITYTEVGTYAYQVLEVKGNVENVTYDRTLYTFDVVVVDNNGQLVASVTDLNNAAITDGEYDVVFNNTYHTAPVSVDITKLVDNKSGDSAVSKAGFEFKAVRTDSNWRALTGADASVLSVFSDASGDARFTATYNEAGTYYYVLTEVKNNAPGWTYSEAEYHITVTVTENNGNLSAAIAIEKTGSENADETSSVDSADATKGHVSFENIYDPEDITVDLDGSVTKVLTGKTLEADQFTFYVYNDGDRTDPLLVGTNNLNGNVNFVNFDKKLTFAGVGKYSYDVVESIPSGAVYDSVTGKYVLDGMSYDATIYDLVVEVFNDISTGKLVANYYFEDAVSNIATFHNSYKATSAQHTFGGSKVLHGRAPRGGEFSFELFEGNSWIETVSNRQDGTFTFKPITYTKAGVYTYTIKEVDGDASGVRYDGVDNPITVTVTVSDTNGVLTAKADISNADIKFENTYTAKPAQIVFNGTKTLAGGDLADNSFTFNLFATDSSFDITKSTSELLATSKNVDGAFTFERILSSTGTYFFAISEDSTVDTVDNIVYDRTVYRFIVRVSDIGDGQLRAVIINANTGVSGTYAANVYADVNFVNATFDEVTEKEVYHEGVITTQIDGQKVEAGDVLTYFITYKNYTGDSVVVDIMDTIPQHTTYVEGSASHNGSYAGSHINWVLNVAKGESVTVSFDVVVNETNAIVANIAEIRDGINSYKTNEVVNHTVDNELVKDVYSPADVTVSIDGKKVYAGDELVYEISFINTTGNIANIKITDAIPENTTYVEGSADNGGVLIGNAIVWDIENVPAWGTVTVAFKVTVNNDVGAVTIDNKATATDGTNNYESDWVSNYTVEDEVDKKVYLSENDQINIDGKKVYEGDELVYTITYVNTAKESATVTITDIVPEYTTYVQGSADNEGVYTDGVITWTKVLDANESVTVSFKVTVDSNIADKEISNAANIIEGKNSYTTNTVTNYTVDDEVKKDAFFNDTTGISIDGKKVYEGDIIAYSIFYKNTARESATVTITDTVPEYTTYVEGSADNDGVYKNGVITWTKTVEANETLVVSFKVKVNSVGNSGISNKATIVEGKNSYTTNEVVNYTVDDEVKKDVFNSSNTGISIDGKKVYAGDVLVYSISYKNNDTAKTTVTITDKIPQYTSYVDGSAENGGVYKDGVITWNIEVEAGATVTVNFKVKVEDAGNVTIANKAEIVEGRNTYYTNEVTNYTVDDEVEKSVYLLDNTSVNIDGKKVYAGDTLVYSISYKNSAPDSATVTITDTIPEYTSYVEGSADNGGVYKDGVITWTLDVAPYTAVTVTFKVTVNENAESTNINNQAVVVEGRNTYTTNEVIIYTVEDEVEKSVYHADDKTANIDGKKVYSGETLVYSISYKNTDTVNSTVTITDKIPEHTSYVEGSADNNGVYNNGVITWVLDVEAGATVTVNFNVKVNIVGEESIVNKAEIVEGRNVYTTNEVTNYTVEDEVVKDVFNADDTKVSIDNTPVKYGDTLLYTISYVNTSLEKATVEITDTVPEYTTYVEGSADNGGVYENGVITWNVEVEAGAKLTVSFKVKVDNVPSATITNKAEVVEGKNTYTTNAVSNTTDNPVIPPSPPTGDNSNIWMWFALLFVSGSVFFTTAVLGRRNKEAEDK